MGLVFVGPSGDVMRKLGDKIQSKLMAEQAGVPVAPWSNGPVETIEEAREHAERIGYPLMIKAAAGGGGRGIRKVPTTNELEHALTTLAPRGRRTRSATAPSSWRRWSATRTTSRCS